MKQFLLIILDSVGIGHAPDSANLGDEGANTLGHIREHVPAFSIPHLDKAGLAAAGALAGGLSIGPETKAEGGGTKPQSRAGTNPLVAL